MAILVVAGVILVPSNLSQAEPGDLRCTLLNPDPWELGSLFGSSACALGDNILVAGGRNNKAYLFDATTGELLRSFPTINECRLVASTGNNFVSASGFSPLSPVRLWDGSTGALLNTFENPNPAFERFGWSVSAAGDDILVGSYEITTGGHAGRGAAYLFDSGTGNLVRTFQAPDPNTAGGFGWSVALAGNNVVVGAIEDDAAGQSTGAVYQFDSSTGTMLHRFVSPSPGSYSIFGNSVGLLGSNILVGEPRVGWAVGWDHGEAHLFDGDTHALIRSFKSPLSETLDHFGRSVAAADNNVLVGAPYHKIWEGWNEGQGIGIVYLLDAITGKLLLALRNPDPQGGPLFGDFVAFLGGKIVVGNQWADIGKQWAGRAYVFDGLPEPGTLWAHALIDGPYLIQEDETLRLDAMLSTGSGDIVSWLWDLDGDGNYDDATGVQTEISFEYCLNTLGLKAGQNCVIGLQVHGLDGAVDEDAVLLRVAPEPATLSLLALGGAVVAARRRKG